MGEMADFANETIWSGIDHYRRFEDASIDTKYDEGLVDEMGQDVYPVKDRREFYEERGG